MSFYLPVILICISGAAFSQNEVQNTLLNQTKEQLLALERSWLKAEFALDTAYLSTIMDSTFSDISEEGVHNKNQSLQSMYDNISQRLDDSVFVDSFNLENTVVNIYNNTAVVIFTVHTYKKEKGKQTEKQTRFYDVWIKRDNEWKAVASQGTAVTE